MLGLGVSNINFPGGSDCFSDKYKVEQYSEKQNKVEEVSNFKKEETAKNDGTLKKIGKFALGSVLACVLGPINAIKEGTIESADAALRVGNIKADNNRERLIQRLPLFIASGVAFGLVLPISIPGAVLSAWAVPGGLTSYIPCVHGIIEGMGMGINTATDIGNSAGQKIAEKYGEKCGKLAKNLTQIFLAIPLAPLFSMVGGCSYAISAAERAVGLKSKDSLEDSSKLDNVKLLKESGMLGGIITGSVLSGKYPLNSNLSLKIGLLNYEANSKMVKYLGGIVPGAGGAASSISGIDAAIKGFVSGVSSGFKMAEDIFDNKKMQATN